MESRASGRQLDTGWVFSRADVDPLASESVKDEKRLISEGHAGVREWAEATLSSQTRATARGSPGAARGIGPPCQCWLPRVPRKTPGEFS